ncbi:MAG: tRNA dimethylallyltransferase, partial [Pseudomonadota bacterium]
NVDQYRHSALVVAPENRALLHKRIEHRFVRMLAEGLVGEVEKLYVRNDLDETLPSIRAVGYRQVWSYLKGECGYAAMKERAVAATRQLAKRQFTWLKREKKAFWHVSGEKNLFQKVSSDIVL